MCIQNYVRVVEVWWDDYKDYFYASRPETLTLAYGDIGELKRFRYSFPTAKNATISPTFHHFDHIILVSLPFLATLQKYPSVLPFISSLFFKKKIK